MKIDCFALGVYETNCYILRQSEQAADCLIIDAGFSIGKLVNFLQQQKLNPVALVLTHGHIDHIAGVNLLRDRFPEMKVYIHKLDAKMLEEPMANLSAISGAAFVTAPADVTLPAPASSDTSRGGGTENDVIDLAGVKLQVLHTPGHTPGGISLYLKEQGVVFSGDALFADSVGRTDFPGGSMTQLVSGIKDKLLTLPDETKVYPGHGPATTIAREKSYNQFLR
jgi:hydroxyacylglutathione hydrolase